MTDSIPDALSELIRTIRAQRVVLDADLARLYGVPTKQFNEAFKRHRVRFPKDFVFQLTRQELANLRSQFATSSLAPIHGENDGAISAPVLGETQSPAGHQGRVERTHGGRRYLPWAFTEHGAVMAANIVRSTKAVAMSVYVVRAFIMQREVLAANATIFKRLAEIDKSLLEHDSALQILWKRLQPLLTPPPEKPRRKIGFHAAVR